VVNDKSTKSRAEKIAATRPQGLADTCYIQKGGIDITAVAKVTDWAKCDQMFPAYSDSRIAAGGPLTDDIFKCQLKADRRQGLQDRADRRPARTAAEGVPGGRLRLHQARHRPGPETGDLAAFKGDGSFAGL